MKKILSFLLIFVLFTTVSCSHMATIIKNPQIKDKHKIEEQIKLKEQEKIKRLAAIIKKVIDKSNIIKSFYSDSEYKWFFLIFLNKAKYQLMENSNITYSDVAKYVEHFQYILNQAKKPYLFYSVLHITKLFNIGVNKSNNLITLKDRKTLLSIVIILENEINKILVDKST